MSDAKRASFVKGECNAVSTRVLPADNWRELVTFFSNGNTTYSVSFGEAAVNLSGIVVESQGHPFTVTREMIGDVITKEAFAIAAGNDSVPMMTVSNPCCRRSGEMNE